MDLIKDLLLQSLLVLFPTFLYQVFLFRKSSSTDNGLQWKTIGMLCLMTAALCMVFSVGPETGYQFDLRMIPLVVAIAYAGFWPGVLTYLLIVLSQLFVADGISLFTTLLNTSLIWILSLLFMRKYKDAHRLTKISFFTGLISMTAIIKVLIVLYTLINREQSIEEYLFIFILFPLLSVVSIWITIHLFENLLDKIMMEKEIQRTERLNVIGHLAASVAHEIRNPMTVVRGFMQIFDKESYIPEHKKAHLKLMIQELDRAEAIINDYLTLAKPRLDTAEKIDIGKQIYFVKDIISAYASLNNVSIIVRVEEDLYVKGNPEKFNQVLINFLKNAIEASPKGEDILIIAYKEKNQVVIQIIDSGIGISAEEIKRLGSPFYSTKETGTGLGLMVCYGIIEAMFGKIEVQSKKGQGTTFLIRFPLE
jgi:two-component system sporulation sensor kinase B